MIKNITFFIIIIAVSITSIYYVDAKVKEVTSDLEKISVKSNYFNPSKIEKGLKLITPHELDTVSSPVKISGKVSGKWFFEGVIVAEIILDDGTLIGTGPLMSEGDWMTEKDVLFEGDVSFDNPVNKNGYIVIKADDPSGLGNVKPYKIKIKFK